MANVSRFTGDGRNSGIRKAIRSARSMETADWAEAGSRVQG